jgi:hypothetical protein
LSNSASAQNHFLYNTFHRTKFVSVMLNITKTKYESRQALESIGKHLETTKNLLLRALEENLDEKEMDMLQNMIREYSAKFLELELEAHEAAIFEPLPMVGENSQSKKHGLNDGVENTAKKTKFDNTPNRELPSILSVQPTLPSPSSSKMSPMKREEGKFQSIDLGFLQYVNALDGFDHDFPPEFHKKYGMVRMASATDLLNKADKWLIANNLDPMENTTVQGNLLNRMEILERKKRKNGNYYMKKIMSESIVPGSSLQTHEIPGDRSVKHLEFHRKITTILQIFEEKLSKLSISHQVLEKGMEVHNPTYSHLIGNQNYSEKLRELLKKVPLFQKAMDEQFYDLIYRFGINLICDKYFTSVAFPLSSGWYVTSQERLKKEKNQLNSSFVSKIERLDSQFKLVEFMCGTSGSGSPFEQNIEECRARNEEERLYYEGNVLGMEKERKIVEQMKEKEKDDERYYDSWYLTHRKKSLQMHELIFLYVDTIYCANTPLLSSNDLVLQLANNIKALKDELDVFIRDFDSIKMRELRVAICFYFAKELGALVSNGNLYEFLFKSIMSDGRILPYINKHWL